MNTRKKMFIKKLIPTCLTAVLFSLAATTSFARDYDAKIVTIIHSGETGTAHSGKQCYFRVEGSGWIYIPRAGAGGSNCALVREAFLNSKPVSVSLTPGTTDEVQYICASLAGPC